MNKEMPLVRIGMIQSAETVHFSCDSAFKAYDLHNKEILICEAGKAYQIKAQKIVPAQIKFCVRIAIEESEDDAKKVQEEAARRSIETTLWHPGVTLKIGSRVVDNHEFWIVTGPFDSLESAEDFAKEYEPTSEAVVVKEISRKSSGVLELESKRSENGVRIVPQDENAVILLHDVMVGIEFHWQHTRTQKIKGILEVAVNNAGKLLAINELGIEDYLISVNSSEMTSENPLELLKAQTIAARSTTLATMGKHHYDENFHLCSDDHCQCYHGVANISEASRLGSSETSGEALMYEGRICDARYAKICGGVMEDYQYVWDKRNIRYLVSGIDGNSEMEYPLTDEEKAMAYIDSKPDVFCNTEKYQITSQLPYNTAELFRWQITCTREELEALIKKRLDDDFGELIDLIPGERGHSGRLIYLDVVGSKKTLRIGKELQIRRVLSESHLYSACFYIRREHDDAGNVIHFHLIGAGWGHGVGLCQVGATVMAQEGYDYKQILAHYYKNSQLKKLY